MKKSNQIIGNIGLFYACYELSKRGWNCLPTTRNAKGVDLVIYSQDAARSHTIQVKALSRKTPVPFGSNPHLIADFVVVVRDVLSDKPDVFVVSAEEVRNRLHKGVKDGRESYWLQPKEYEEFKDNWEVIGPGW